MLTQTVKNRIYDFSHQVGGRELMNAVAITIGEGDDIYCINRLAPMVAVRRIIIGTTPGDEEVVGQFGRRGEGDGEFVWPTGIALDSEYNVYVTDEWLHRVTMFAQDGTFLRHWGGQGDGDGELNGPAGIVVDSNDDIYIVDSLNHQVQKFTKEGKYLARWGGLGSEPGEFNSPWGITVDDHGYVYVADHQNHRAQKFTADGDYVAQFGSYGSGRGQLNRPADVAVDPEGDIYICDWANNRVQIFADDGEFITSFIGDAQELSKWFKMTVDASLDVYKARRRVSTLEPEWRLAMPCSIVFDSKNSRLIIADTQRRRVQIYNKLKDYLEPEANL